MTPRTVLKGGTVVDSRGERKADVAIENGSVVEVGASLKGEQHVDVTGCVVAPGFVDLHAHLREPGKEEAETIETGSRAGAKGGYTLDRAASEITVREIIAAAELVTFDLHCETHPVDSERCSSSHSCSVRPVWMMLQHRIDEVLEGVKLSDLLLTEAAVRSKVGLPARADVVGGRTGLPVLQ